VCVRACVWRESCIVGYSSYQPQRSKHGRSAYLPLTQPTYSAIPPSLSLSPLSLLPILGPQEGAPVTDSLALSAEKMRELSHDGAVVFYFSSAGNWTGQIRFRSVRMQSVWMRLWLRL
jgi:hypothetical protein